MIYFVIEFRGQLNDIFNKNMTSGGGLSGEEESAQGQSSLYLSGTRDAEI